MLQLASRILQVAQNQPFQLSFDASLKVDFKGSRLTADGGLILVRELDERLGLGGLIAQRLTDSRRGKNTQLPLADLFRQSVYSRIAGHEDVKDAERFREDLGSWSGAWWRGWGGTAPEVRHDEQATASPPRSSATGSAS